MSSCLDWYRCYLQRKAEALTKICTKLLVCYDIYPAKYFFGIEQLRLYMLNEIITWVASIARAIMHSINILIAK